MTVPIRVRKRPVEVDAYRFTGDNAADIVAWVGAAAFTGANGELVIVTLEGDHRADVGDYILRGVAGEFYPVKPRIFEATYDLVAER